jgi:hypothetical protein
MVIEEGMIVSFDDQKSIVRSYVPSGSSQALAATSHIGLLLHNSGGGGGGAFE